MTLATQSLEEDTLINKHHGNTTTAKKTYYQIKIGDYKAAIEQSIPFHKYLERINPTTGTPNVSCHASTKSYGLLVVKVITY